MKCPLTKEARSLIKKYWPGPLTIILRSRNGKKIGFRMPANKTALELIKRTRVPVVAPSANISGKLPPTSAAEALKYLDGRVDLVIDGGRANVGVESTVVDLSGKTPVILREGAIPARKIFKVINNG